MVTYLLLCFVVACEPMMSATKQNNKTPPVFFTCLTSQSQCMVNTKFGRVSIQFHQPNQLEKQQGAQASQDKIKTENPFFIQLRFDDLENTSTLQNITSYLEGVTMYMGKIPVFFKNHQDHIIIAESLLGSCSANFMTWRLWVQADVLIDDEIQHQDFFIDFNSSRI